MNAQVIFSYILYPSYIPIHSTNSHSPFISSHNTNSHFALYLRPQSRFTLRAASPSRFLLPLPPCKNPAKDAGVNFLYAEQTFPFLCILIHTRVLRRILPAAIPLFYFSLPLYSFISFVLSALIP